ncbi:phosphotransferase [Actinopolymorpha sp. B17G11]|uniref:phosphotransferase enzyme family protein n=1 Tax=Actinopolymorpha sp. B17G11 TaxID=3160861 RepID=UPI0032E4119B
MGSPRTNASYVARHYRRTQGAAELVFELAAVRYLAEQGFPVADVVEAGDGARFDYVQGRPCALFHYVAGTAGDSPGESGCADLTSGITAARLLAQMHLVTRGRTFPGSRSERSDPLMRLTQWVRQDGADPEFLDIPGGPAFLHHLQRLLHTLNFELAQRTHMWVGLVHGDVAPNNLVLDSAGTVAALIDFDDCLYSYVIYDLASILWYWGRSAGGNLDVTRTRRLIEAYCDVRELTADERHLLAPLLAAYLAADAIGQITWWWRGAGKPRPVAEIDTARGYLELTTNPSAEDLFADQS